ncbi:Apolipoprotein N-acyltransferase [Aquimixticola soesokkakensis]|uniref:Apolipoprotein N-acyltransferase n=1 Tax=Aquimixticola soesokkakensis TaxID=1519096 RepID=A0A1Y5TAD4_9RHOB|nr:apolipoprotein N-acyltransferase [Aquimixticola soesokkakensis]SLN59318.1 Apolipoprotein N-acyltransferase [Aquimixticola soesokkakensis]
MIAKSGRLAFLAAPVAAPLCAVLAGLCMALGQVPFGLWPLALCGMVAGLWLWQRADAVKAAAWIGWGLGAGAFGGSIFWIVEPFFVEPEKFAWMSPFAFVFMNGGLALFWALAFGLGKRLRFGVFGVAALWGLAELARGYVFTGFPWSLPAYIWTGTPVIQWVAFIGPYGLTVLGFILAALVVRAIASRAMAVGGIAAIALAGLFAVGMWRGALPVPPDHPQSVRVIQPNAPQAEKWDPVLGPQHFARGLAASDPQGASLVIWPETAVMTPLDWAESELAAMRAAAPGVPVLTGIQRVEDYTHGFNSAVLMGAGGEIVATYDKHHLVPFGEYMPMPQLLARIGLRAFTAQEGFGYTAGAGPALIDLGPLGRALPLICYEAIFPRDLRGTERPDWIVQLTNDAWFGKLAGPQQSFAQARVRAIEQGLPLVRAANTGVSAIIDARGHIRAAIPLGEAGGVTAALPGALAMTPYARWGEMLTICVLAAMLIAAALWTFATRSPRKTS